MHLHRDYTGNWEIMELIDSHAHIDADSVEGPYCAIRKCKSYTRSTTSGAAEDIQPRLFADLMEAEEWARECPCGSPNPGDHFVRIVEPLERPESAAFRGREDWKHHRAAELLQMWEFIAKHLAGGPASETELNHLLDAAEANGKATWVSGDPSADLSKCMPVLYWAYSNKLITPQYREDLSTIEFSL